MNASPVLIRGVCLFTITVALWASGPSLAGEEVTITRTNWVERWITNEIDVRMPVNRFVNEYRTNWVTQLRTNVVDVYLTNWAVRNLTNWQTVVLFKTNWLTQPVTNLVEIDLPSRAVTPAETAPLAPMAAWTGPLAIEAVRTARPPANDLVEVQMQVRRTDNTPAPLQVQQWRVEREDGAILLFGQEQDFKRQLPLGKYKVEAKLKTEGDNLPLSLRGTLSVTTREAVVQPRLVARK
jgi:hypothetical protein